MAQMTYTRHLARLTLIYAAALWMMAAPNGFGQETTAKIRVAIPSPSICCLHLFAAQQWKTFEENGLDVEIIQMRPQVANARHHRRRDPLFRRSRVPIQSRPLCGQWRRGRSGSLPTS